MIRIEEDAGWRLVEHREHARLAGEFARQWGNAEFAPPEPRDDILLAVTRHDDAWSERDASPAVTREGRPAAFSSELVGSYSAFEEIDLADYLAVRARATEAVARDNPFAAIIVSMHTVNLLTEQADLRGLSAPMRAIHQDFVAGQRERQGELAAQVATHREGVTAEPMLTRAFCFLQVCDSLSLVACVRFTAPIVLRHEHPRRDGRLTRLLCTPLGQDVYRVSPYPFARDGLTAEVPTKWIKGRRFADAAALRAAYHAAAVEPLAITIVR
jgi:hypothetical protein